MSLTRRDNGWKWAGEVRSWRFAVMGGSRYRFGVTLKRAAWDKGRPIGFTAGLGVCVVTGIKRNHR